MFCFMKVGLVLRKCGKFVYLFRSNTGTKFRETHHSNHVIPHRVILSFGAKNVKRPSLWNQNSLSKNI